MSFQWSLSLREDDCATSDCRTFKIRLREIRTPQNHKAYRGQYSPCPLEDSRNFGDESFSEFLEVQVVEADRSVRWTGGVV